MQVRVHLGLKKLKLAFIIRSEYFEIINPIRKYLKTEMCSLVIYSFEQLLGINDLTTGFRRSVDPPEEVRGVVLVGHVARSAKVDVQAVGAIPTNSENPA